MLKNNLKVKDNLQNKITHKLNSKLKSIMAISILLLTLFNMSVYATQSVITYDANGGTFSNGSTTNVVTYNVVEEAVTKISKTSNVSDDGLTADTTTGYGNNKSTTDVVTIPGATELTVKITYQTEGTGWDWICLFDGTITNPATASYTESVPKEKLGGTTKKTETYTIPGDTVQIYFKSDYTGCNYYGYYAEISGNEFETSINSGTYRKPKRENYQLLGWSTDSNATEVEYKLGEGNIPLESVATLYAVWKKIGAPLITEWTIPADVDGTGKGTTIKLPIPAYSTNNFTVNWGDGKTENFDSSANFPSHTYKNTVKTTYTISITGTVNQFGFTNTSKPTSSSSSTYVNYYTFTQYLTGLLSWGELEATRYGFSYCQNLSSTIPEPTENTFKNVTSMGYLFYYCNKLIGNIPNNLFSNASKVTSFYATFYNCSSLSGEIPAGLFSSNSEVTSFYMTFSGCSGLSGSIPAELFSSTSGVTSFGYTFNDCSGLSGSIPAELFSSNSEVTSFYLTFSGCSGLSGSIPAELFSSTSGVTSFYGTFNGCSGLSGEIPAELFSSTSEVTSFEYTFNGCSGLSGSIPAGLFSSNSGVTKFSNTFSSCIGLSGEIPAGLFSSNSGVTSFYMTFSSCSGLRGEIPAGLFSSNSGVTTFYRTFNGCSGLRGSIPAGLFSNNSKVTTFYSTFNGCSGLSGEIPAELFSSNSQVTSFYCTFLDCISLSGEIPAGLFSSNSEVTTFSSTFEGCSGLRGSIPAGLFSSNSEVTTFASTFEGCSGLRGSIPAGLFSNNSKVTNFANTFSDCSRLTGSIPEGLFANNVGITSNSSTSNGYAQTFYRCTGITSVELDTRFVGCRMFYGCDKLKEITISDKLEGIYGTSGAFRYTGYNPSILPTTLKTTNSVALNYNWSADKRIVELDDFIEIDPGTFDDKDLVMQWKIPVDADGAGNGTTIKLPIPAYSTNNFTVNWGDGKTETFDSSANFPSHTYTNTVKTIYTIKITGMVNQFGYIGAYQPTSSSSSTYVNYYTFTEYLTGLLSWGELEATMYGFSYCQNLSSTIPEPTENTFKNVTSMVYLFNECNKLTGNIPNNLFSNASKVTSFYDTFSGCERLSGAIPAGLFSSNSKVTTFDRTFYGCRGLSGSIPAGLFSSNSEVTTFAHTFYDCSGLSGEIPAGLFSSNSGVTSFEGTFNYCISLSGEIPTGLFSSNSKVTTFAGTFSECSGLTGSIPAGLFSSNSKVTNFATTFNGCSGLTGSIPAGLFSSTSGVTSFYGTFFDCISLSGEIPAGLFSSNSKVTTFVCTFSDCSGLTGSIPAELFSSNSKVTTFDRTFYGCSGLTGSIPTELFSSNSGVTNFYGTFNGCSGLSGSIPAGLFSSTSGVTTFYDTFNGCSGLSGSIPAELFSSNSGVTNFSNTFYGCSGLNGSIPAGLFANNVGITSNSSSSNGYARTFYNCTGITSVELDTRFVGYQMFYGCNKLTEITISDKLEGIYGTSGAFRYTGSNPSILPTTLKTTNSVVLNYNWSADKRAFDIDYNASFTFTPTTSYTYDGIEKKPTVTEVIRNGVTLVEGTDYEVVYADNIAVGTAKVIVYGIGLYTGSIEKTFTILPKDITITAKNQTITYGDRIATDSSAITADGLVEGHTITYITVEPSITNAGTGTVIPSDVEIFEDSYDVTSNYNIAYNTGTLTINKKTLTVTPNSNQSKMYGTTDPTLTYTYSGQVNGETPGFTGALTRVSGENIGTYKINLGTLALADNGTFKKSNYTLAFSTTAVNFTINKNAITITAKAQTINYGNSITTGTGQVTVVTLASGHTLSSITLTPSITNVGTGVITPSGAKILSGSTDISSNYDITYKTGVLTINKKTLTVTPNSNQSKTYGDTDPTLTYTYSGQATGETPKFTGALTRAAGENFGTYKINVGTLALTDNGTFKASNYTLAFSTTTVNFTINKKAITITAKAQTIDYGDSITTGTGQVTVATLVSGHKLNSITLTPSITNAGKGTITPKTAKILSGTTDVTSNYSITYKTGVLTINKIDPTVTLSEDSGTVTYNATNTFTVTSNVAGKMTVTSGATGYVSITGGNNASLTANTASTVTYKGLATKQTATTITVVFTPTDTTNYNTVTKTYSVTAVNNATINVTKSEGYTGTYDGASHGITVTYGTTATTATIMYGTKRGEYTLTAAPTYKDAGTYTVYYRIEAANYTTVYDSEVVKINKKSVAVTWSNLELEYTGSNLKPTAKATGITGETINLTVTATAVNVGTYQATAAINTVTNGSKDNYTLTNTTTNFTIKATDAAFSVSLEKSTYEYDGTAHTPKATVTANGKTLTKDTDYTVAYSNNTNYGTATVTVTGKGNYSQTATAGFSITKRTLTVTPNSNQSKYFGKTNPTLKYSYSGQVSGQTPAFTGALTRATGEDAGSYLISKGTLALKDNGTFLANNYTLAFSTTPVNFTIKAIPLDGSVDTITATLGTTSMEYTGTERKPSVSVTAGTVTLVSGTDYTATYANNVNVGTNTATVTITGNKNYSGTITKTFSITKKKLTVTPNANQSKIYGDDDAKLTYSYSGNVSGQTPKFTGALTRVAGETVGKYKINVGTLALADNGTFKVSNYTLAFSTTTVNYEIKAKAITITAKPQTITYKNSIATGTSQVTVETLVSGHSLNSITLTPSITNAGTGVITPSVAKILSGTTDVTSNYDITYKTGALTINKKILIVTPNANQSKIYGATEPTLTYSYSGQLTGETPKFTGGLTREAGENIGTYKINLGTLALVDNGTFKAGNYTLAFDTTTVNFTINKADAPLTTSETNVMITEKNTVKVTYIYDGDANVTISNTDDSKATATLDRTKKTITIVGVAEGTTIITISALGTNYNDKTATVNVTVNPANYKVGTIYYPTLESAVKGASNGDIIQVQRNVLNDLSNPNVDKEVTIDLKGFTITKTVKGITNNGTLIITDTSGAKTGTIQTTNATNNEIASLISNNGTTTIENGTLINNGHLTSNWRTISCYANSELNVNGGTLKTTLTSGETTDYVSRTIGIYAEGAKVNITDGEVINEFMGGLSIESYDENLNTSISISGGNVRSEGTGSMGIRIGTSGLPSATSLNITGGSVFGELHGIIVHADCTGAIKISGGEVTANANNALKNESTKNSVLITGGTLSTNTYAGITNSTANLTIGTSSDAVDTATPVIIGGSYALNAINGFNFYDGILKGKSGTIYGGTVAEKVKLKPDGYGVFFDTETIGGVKYETARLEIGWDISNPDSADNDVWAYLVEDEANAGMYKMIIRGTGAMKNFVAYPDVPWVDYRAKVSKIVIQSGVTSVGDRAFYNFTKITTIAFTSTLTRIGTYSFNGCSSMKGTITIPKAVTRIGYNPFLRVPIDTIIVEEGNTNYKADNGVLYTLDGTTLITYPIGKTDTSYIVLDGTTIISTYAFDSAKITTIKLPSTLKTIYNYAFQNSSITSVTIPSNVNRIFEYAFYGTTSLETVYLKSNQLGYLSDNLPFGEIKVGSKIYTTSKSIADKFVADTHYTKANTVVYYPPEITVHPVDAKVINPNKATFTIEAAYGNPNDISYKWQYRENAGAEWKDTTEAQGTTNNSGLTSTFTTVASVPEMADYQYRAVLSSSEYPNVEMTQEELANVLVSKEATFIREYIDITKGLLHIEDMEYTGQETKPDVVLTVEGVTLIKNVDYTVEYQNNIESGMGVAIIKGIGNCKNTIIGRYLIYLTQTPTIDVTDLTVGAEVSNTATNGDDLTPPNVVTEGQTDTEGVWSTSDKWTKEKELTIKGIDNETQIVRIKFQDVENSTTGNSFEDMYGIMERDKSGNPILNIRNYNFKGYVDGYVTAAIYLQDDSGNETTKYLRIYNLDNKAPVIDYVTNTEENLNIKAQIKDEGSGLQYFAVTKDTQVEEPTKVDSSKLNITSSGMINASDKSALNTWYSVDNPAEINPSATNAQDVTITFGKLSMGRYKFWAKDLAGNVSCVEFEVEKYKYYSILATVKAQNGLTGEELLVLTQGTASSRTIKLDYLGDLVNPYIKILLQKKTGVSSNGNQYETIKNTVTVSECNPVLATQDIQANFAGTLASGEYQLRFELYDKYDCIRSAESLEFKVN